MKWMESSWWGEKEVEADRSTDKIKNKCYIGIRGVYTTKRAFSVRYLEHKSWRHT